MVPSHVGGFVTEGSQQNRSKGAYSQSQPNCPQAQREAPPCSAAHTVCVSTCLLLPLQRLHRPSSVFCPHLCYLHLHRGKNKAALSDHSHTRDFLGWISGKTVTIKCPKRQGCSHRLREKEKLHHTQGKGPSHQKQESQAHLVVRPTLLALGKPKQEG